MRVIKSRIREFLPRELLIELNDICYDVTIPDNNTKINLMVTALDKYDIDYTELGSGTNRHAILIDGFVFKIAMDRFGVKDNWAEFAIAKELQPYVTKTYECNGLIVVAEYVTVISKDEFLNKKDKIRQILSYLAQGYLMGDVGSISKNFMNWGYRDDGQLVILDFAYIYKIKGEEMVCGGVNSNGDICEEFLEYDENFYKLVCPRCRKTYTFYDIRKKIDPAFELKEVEMTKQLAYQTTEPVMVIDGSDSPTTEEIKPEDIYGKDEESMYNKDNEYDNKISNEELEAMYENALDDIPSIGVCSDDPIEEGEDMSIAEVHFDFDEVMETADEYLDDIVEESADVEEEKTNPEYQEMKRSTIGLDDDDFYNDPEDEEYVTSKYDEIVEQIESSSDDEDYDDKPMTISETISESISEELQEEYDEIKDDPECVVTAVDDYDEDDMVVEPENESTSSITFIDEDNENDSSNPAPEHIELTLNISNDDGNTVADECDDDSDTSPEDDEDSSEDIGAFEGFESDEKESDDVYTDDVDNDSEVINESITVEKEIDYDEDVTTTTTRTTIEKVEVKENKSFVEFIEPEAEPVNVDEMREMLKNDSGDVNAEYQDDYDDIYDEITEEQINRKYSQKKGGPSWQ